MLFEKNCANCHQLFGKGNKIGPDLTGTSRKDAPALMANIVDPSAVMAREYQPLIVRLGDGRTITGIKKEETADSLLAVDPVNEAALTAKVRAAQWVGDHAAALRR